MIAVKRGLVSFSFFDEDYFERGLESGKSFYQNYRWLPEATMSLAMTIIDFLGIQKEDTILDYGCSKGFLVKAFRLLHRQAWGVDISDYALANVDPMYKKYCYHLDNWDLLIESVGRKEFDFCIAKDVWEHLDVPVLKETIENLSAKNLFSIIPIGHNGSYVAVVNDLDASHVICEGENWWRNLFDNVGWECAYFSYKIEGIKDSYAKSIPKSHIFCVHQRKEK